MIGMQYKVILPKNYDMGIIRKRVQDNGQKTDGFPVLNFKAYLITEAEENENLYNSYAPLYIWNNYQGMNKFIFEGFYDNILESFGWQKINIGVSLSINLDKDFNNSRYIVEYAGNIPKSKSLSQIPLNTINQYVKNAEESLGNLLVYNPDKWGYSQFSFYQEKPEIDSLDHLILYEVLYIPQ
ncbi:DUF4865 family protein [Bacillus toyonensis]|uniref:DUF4865 family protein n=1 Tax=Bacillus toyonensis TaxID=155322 RepID=UPI000BF30D49|nr:DUF4865 family protein [Bacillus toyonensis]PGE66821.1 DUF4865 domain-containing protein [Bacillus toyonensis]PHD36655.1 DUF4865 domain-containing protein [Bacillus toyonensis]HDR7688982.1 DUF4865 family protein [Bacillus toyonensis]